MRRLAGLIGLALLVYAAQIFLDLRSDSDPFVWREFLFEDSPGWLLLAAVISAACYVALRLKDSLAERHVLSLALDAAAEDRNRWRASARTHAEGLAKAIHQQFDSWRLTDSERDVAMLTLKGLSHKEIARFRQSSSATVRQQAAAVYAKSNLSSRAELAAYFLEDIFPSPAMPQVQPAASGICQTPEHELASPQRF